MGTWGVVWCFCDIRFLFLRSAIALKLPKSSFCTAHTSVCSADVSSQAVCPFAVGPKILQYVVKVIAQAIQLLYTMLQMEQPAYILLQVCVIHLNSIALQDILAVSDVALII